MAPANPVFKAEIKGGANSGHVVHVSHFDQKSGKFLVDYPHSSAVGYFLASELFPVGDWYFGEQHQLSPGKRTRPEFIHGDPFSLIAEGHARAAKPVLITTHSGNTTLAYPASGHLTPSGFCYSLEYQEFLMVLVDPYFEDPARIPPASYSDPAIIREQDIAAWGYLPVLRNQS